MKPASFVLVVLALAVGVAWPLSSAIGAASVGAFERMALGPAACQPEQAAMAPSGAAEDDGQAAAALPPGHPPIGEALPPGHPPIAADGLPPGHPPIGRGLPPGHPPIPSGQGPATPTPVELFGAPVLLTI